MSAPFVVVVEVDHRDRGSMLSLCGGQRSVTARATTKGVDHEGRSSTKGADHEGKSTTKGAEHEGKSTTKGSRPRREVDHEGKSTTKGSRPRREVDHEGADHEMTDHDPDDRRGGSPCHPDHGRPFDNARFSPRSPLAPRLQTAAHEPSHLPIMQPARP